MIKRPCALLTSLFALSVSGVGSLPVWARGEASPPGVVHEHSANMDTIHRLFGESGKIRRTVKKLAHGVETTTGSSDPKVRALLREHIVAMHARLGRHQPIRSWDPLFADLFKHADRIKLEVFPSRQGFRTRVTSTDPDTVRLIHAHGDAVSGFIKEGSAGMARRHESPLAVPPSKAAKAGFLGKGDGVKTCPVTGEPVARSVKAEIGGSTVYFCCPSCVAVVKKNPGRYLKP